MSNTPSEKCVVMTHQERRDANEFIVTHLQNTMINGSAEIHALRKKLAVTYWVVVCISVIMFFVGIALLSVPIFAARWQGIEALKAFGAAGFGLANIAALFFFRPLDRMHRMMGDMSQLTLALNSFQNQVGLRLMEMDATQRSTIGKAAEHIDAAARESIKLVQCYFEACLFSLRKRN